MQKHTAQKVSRSLEDKEKAGMLRVLLHPSLASSKILELDFIFGYSHLHALPKEPSRGGKEAEARWFK